MKDLNYFLEKLQELTKETGLIIELNIDNYGFSEINIIKLEKEKYIKDGFYSWITKDNNTSNTLGYDLLWEYDGEE